MASWQRYRQTADHPNWFTRWALERTLAVLGAAAQHHSSSQTDASEARNLEKVQAAVAKALEQQPLHPPVPVDRKVDMLLLELDSDQALCVAQVFTDTESLTNVPLDALQGKRKNPWGGFREAWLEHYNHRLAEGETKSATYARGSVEMAETEVQSEVAGTVWKVQVAAGDTVSKDQELMILESMKMEIPVDAPCAGTVVSVLVAPEEGIEEDQVLLIIES